MASIGQTPLSEMRKKRNGNVRWSHLMRDAYVVPCTLVESIGLVDLDTPFVARPPFVAVAVVAAVVAVIVAAAAVELHLIGQDVGQKQRLKSKSENVGQGSKQK